MRLFLALNASTLDLSDSRLKKLFTSLSSKNIEYRRIPDEQLHIPLVEIGDVGRGTFLGLHHKLKDLILMYRPIELKISGLWAHPYQKEADMLWLGVQNSRELRALQSDLADVLGIDEENFFRPHVPLLYLEKMRDVSDLISPFKRLDLGIMKIDQMKFLEKLPAPLGFRMTARYTFEDVDRDENNGLEANLN